MKLDLNKPWVRKLVLRHSVKNGCSFIRGILLHYLFMAIAIGAGVVIGAVMLAGIPTLLYIIFGTEGGLSAFWSAKHLDFLGTEWYFRLLSVSVIADVIVLGLAGIILGFYVLSKMPTVFRKMKVDSHLPKSVKQVGSLINEAMYAVYHKVCPKLEFELPVELQSLSTAKRIRSIPFEDHDCFGHPIAGREQFGTIASVVVENYGIIVNVNWETERMVVRDEIYIRWHQLAAGWFFERYELDPVEKEISPA